jgi:deoxyribodipyrimidine photo-lyase
MTDHSAHFPPTLAAAHARLAGVDIPQYAKTRNAILGQVSRLSPYITHGYLTLPHIAQAVQHHAGFNAQHKFVFELGWRAYFHHVWGHRGDGIFESLHAGVLPDSAYQPALPADIQTACTGIAVIDQAVSELVQTGYLHNHARMWLASYVVHLRKVHWLTGAHWMYGHLLDGDLASNMLSWQWIAGTASTKPYLFNADNVAKYAPQAWHCEATVLDTGYEQLAAIAQSTRAVPAQPSALKSVGLAEHSSTLAGLPPTLARLFTADQIKAIEGKDVQLLHPWSLGELPSGLSHDTRVIGLLDPLFHAAHPWSQPRWDWVLSRMHALCHCVIAPDSETLQAVLSPARSVHYVDNLHAGWLNLLKHPQLTVTHSPALFTEVNTVCPSFSSWWHKTKLCPLPEAQPVGVHA